MFNQVFKNGNELQHIKHTLSIIYPYKCNIISIDNIYSVSNIVINKIKLYLAPRKISN